MRGHDRLPRRLSEKGDWVSTIPLPWVRSALEKSSETEVRAHTREERIRLALNELGTTFIKLGQILATRPDLVGPDLATELSKLQTSTRADPSSTVRAAIKRELGRSPEELFAHFEAKPFASASIAQAHHAQLFSGEQVVVKVQKEGVRETVAQDLAIMANLASLIEAHNPRLRSYEPVRLVEEFRRTITNELDFVRERTHLETFNSNFKDDPSVCFPRAFSELSTERILTMQYLDGILGADVDALYKSGADLQEFARKGAGVYLEMIFRDSFYHADPHPGNLMLLPGGVVGIIDCGMVGRIDGDLHDDFGSLILSVSEGDAELLANILWRLSQEKPSGGRARLLQDIEAIFSDATEVSLDQIDMGGLLKDLVELTRRYRITLQPGLSQLIRTLTLLEGTAQILDPKFSLTQVLRPYCDRVILERFEPKTIIRHLGRSYRDWERLLQTLPRDLGEALDQLQMGKIQVRIEQRHLATAINRFVVGLVLATLLLGSCILWSSNSPPLVHGVSAFGAGGYALATIAGIWLWRSVVRSSRSSADE